MSLNNTTILPEKAKLKTIKYKKLNYEVSGYVYENQFVEGQNIVVVSVPSSSSRNRSYFDNEGVPKTIVSGTYFIENGVSFLESTIKKRHAVFDDIIAVEKVIFRVTNDITGKRLITDTKNATKLNVEKVDIIEYKSNYSDTENLLTLQKQSSDTYKLRIEFNDNDLEVIVSSDTIKKYGFYSFDDFITKAKKVRLDYKNGDTFIGSVRKSDNRFSSARYTPKYGEYQFKTGEIYTGNLTINTDIRQIFPSHTNCLIFLSNRIRIPNEGETKFTDGTIANGDWLKQYEYKLTENEWKQVYNDYRNLTDIRNAVIRIDLEKQQKNQEQKISNELKKEKLRQKYISRYGEYYGNIISKGELITGMSMDMVNEIWNKDFFNQSTVVRNDQTIEIWEFDKQKMEMKILKEGAKNKDNNGVDAAMLAIYLINFSDKSGILNVPKMLIFKNNKLTDIYN